MEKALSVQKFGSWRVILTTEKPYHGDEFPFPDEAIDGILEKMKLFANKVVGTTVVDGYGEHSKDKEDHGTYLDCLQPGECSEFYKPSICLTVNLDNREGNLTKLKVLDWLDSLETAAYFSSKTYTSSLPRTSN